jgi:demethoxyubiquinone hydroxylase (CLK1/Coq7/Cat5 family)
MQTGTTDTETTVEQLNSFLRGEMSAIEAYRQVIEKVKNGAARQQLLECQRSHEQRVSLLRQRIVELGGTPAAKAGAWGAFAKLIEGGAKALGESAAIAVVEEGEDHGRNDYKRDLGKLDLETRKIIESKILPEQERTHGVVSTLKKTLH